MLDVGQMIIKSPETTCSKARGRTINRVHPIVEPHIDRDLARAYYGPAGLAELVGNGYFQKSEYAHLL